MEKSKISARFAPRILIPSEALPWGCVDNTELVTSDGVSCLAHFLSTWDNSSGIYEEQLDGLCRRQWDCSFDLVRTMWQGRLDSVGNVWNYLELIKIEK